MVKRSTWWATAVGTAVGTGGWMLGLGKLVSQTHPGWALLFITIAATLVTQVAVEAVMKENMARMRNEQG
jgi:hypothetical protein